MTYLNLSLHARFRSLQEIQRRENEAFNTKDLPVRQQRLIGDRFQHLPCKRDVLEAAHTDTCCGDSQRPVNVLVVESA